MAHTFAAYGLFPLLSKISILLFLDPSLKKNLVKVFQENISPTERSYPNCVPDGAPAAGVDAKFRTFACSAPYQESKLCKKV